MGGVGGALYVSCTRERSGGVEGEGERKIGVVDVDHLLRARVFVFTGNLRHKKSQIFDVGRHLSWSMAGCLGRRAEGDLHGMSIVLKRT